MKKLSSQMLLKPLLVFLSIIMNAILWAQDSSGVVSKSVTKESTTTTTEWYSQPWVWIVGGAVFIIILVALIRGGSGNKEISRSNTTVIKDRDTI